MNSVTHEPVARALVYSADERYATFTDEHGRFELNLSTQDSSGFANSSIVLESRRPGFSSRGNNFIRVGQDDVTLLLVPEALITGKVKFPSEESGDRVQVQLYQRVIREGFGQWVPLTTDRTRLDGEFRFANLQAGDYKIFTLENMEQGQSGNGSSEPPWGFPPRFFPAARDFASAETIHLRAGEAFVANIPLERQRYYDVRIPVVGIDEGALQGLNVAVYAQGRRGPGFELGFDPRQRAITGSLPNGTYTVEAQGYGAPITNGATAITVANRATVGPPLAVAVNPSIEVNVRKDMSGADSAAQQNAMASSGGMPAQVALVSAEETALSRAGGPGMFFAQGNPLKLDAVVPGRYWVQVRPFGGYAASVTSGGKDLLREPLVVASGSSVPPIEITLRYDTGEIEATIGGSKETPTTGGVVGSINPMMQQPSSVYCIPFDGNQKMPLLGQGSVINGQIMQTTVPQVPPGEYRVLAFTSPVELEYRNPAAMKKYESQGQVVKVLPGQKAQVIVRAIESE